MLGDPLPDRFFLTVAVCGIGAYLAGVRRLRRAGHSWPVARTLSWLGGMLLLAAVTGLGVARYAYVLFSVHMLAMVAHAFFGFVLLQSATVIGAGWYPAVHPSWAPAPRTTIWPATTPSLPRRQLTTEARHRDPPAAAAARASSITPAAGTGRHGPATITTWIATSGHSCGWSPPTSPRRSRNRHGGGCCVPRSFW
jgi:hypothetical protein